MLGAGVNSDSGLVGSIVLNERNFDIFRFPTSLADFFEGRAFRGAGQEFRIEACPARRFSATPSASASRSCSTALQLAHQRLLSRPHFQRIHRRPLRRPRQPRPSVHQGMERQRRPPRRRTSTSATSPFGAPSDYTDAYGHNIILVAPSVTVDLGHARFVPAAHRRRHESSSSYEQVFGNNTFPIFNLEGEPILHALATAGRLGQARARRAQPGLLGRQQHARLRTLLRRRLRSIRGFEFRGVGPNVNGFKVGGDFMFLNSLEYQIPIRANDNLYFVAFVDSGTVESKVGITRLPRLRRLRPAHRRADARPGADRARLRLPDRPRAIATSGNCSRSAWAFTANPRAFLASLREPPA